MKLLSHHLQNIFIVSFSSVSQIFAVMPSIKWQAITSSPLIALQLISLASFRSVLAIFKVFTQPSRPLSIRTELARIWVGTSFSYNSDIWYSAPQNHNIQSIDTNGTLTYVIPTTKLEDIKNADAILVYGHGGGLFIGHPLQYIDEYKRWVALAASRGKKLVILAPVYRRFSTLSPILPLKVHSPLPTTKMARPAQRPCSTLHMGPHPIHPSFKDPLWR
jgi:hypothetical protein